jgi:hypothetical protein
MHSAPNGATARRVIAWRKSQDEAPQRAIDALSATPPAS